MRKIHVGTRKVLIRESGIHGLGIFSKRPIKKGEIAVILKGHMKRLIVKNSKDSQLGPNWVGIGKNLWIDPNPPICYLNHSCNPTVGIRGKLLFVALRDIKANEEVTLDYSITEDDTYWEFKCRCGAANCRKTIRSIQFLPERIFNKYMPYVPSYFKKVYLRYTKSNAH